MDLIVSINKIISTFVKCNRLVKFERQIGEWIKRFEQLPHKSTVQLEKKDACDPEQNINKYNIFKFLDVRFLLKQNT